MVDQTKPNRALLGIALAILALTACTPTQIAPYSATVAPTAQATPASPRATPTSATPSSTRAAASSPTAEPTREPVWQPSGLAGQNLRAVAADPRQPATLYAGGAGLLKSTDAGKTWTTLRADLQVRAIAVSPADAAVVYAGATDGCLKGTTAPSYRSADGGKTWTAIGGNLTSYAPHSTRAEIVFAASCSGVARSTDGGKTWQSLEGSRPAGYDVARVALAPSAPDVVYALSASEGGTVAVTKSEDGGKSWRNVTPREEMWAPTALAIDPGNPKVAYSVTGKGAFRTTDGGAGWTSANAGLDGIRHVDSSFVSYPLSALALDPTRPEVLYLGTGGGRPEGAGVFRSWDGARQWHRVGDGLGTRPVRDLTFAGGLVFAATSDGVWRLQW